MCVPYPVGSKVVHPCYGAGTVVHIQEKTIGPELHRYYVIDTVGRAMRLMVPVSNAGDAGLRHIGGEATLRQILDGCGIIPKAEEIDPDLRARQADMRERLKSGEFSVVVNVVRLLFFMNTRRPLGSVDRQLFDRGKELLAGELALASDVKMADAMREVEGTLARMVPVRQE